MEGVSEKGRIHLYKKTPDFQGIFFGGLYLPERHSHRGGYPQVPNSFGQNDPQFLWWGIEGISWDIKEGEVPEVAPSKHAASVDNFR